MLKLLALNKCSNLDLSPLARSLQELNISRDIKSCQIWLNLTNGFLKQGGT